MAGLIGSHAQFMRSAADSCPNILVSKSQSLLDSELRAARAIDSTVDDLHRGGLPSRQRDTDPLRPDAKTLAAIAGNPAHPLHGATVFGLGHDEQTPERIDDRNAFHRARGREIKILAVQLPHEGYANSKLTPQNRMASGRLILSFCMVPSLKAASEKAKRQFKILSATVDALTSMEKLTI